MNEHNTQTLRAEVMDAIHKGHVRMKPRWHFVLLSLLVALGSIIAILALIYVASLSVFLLRDSGVWFAPSFGLRGWFALFHALPYALLLLIILFVLILELLVRRYTFVYRKPLLVSVGGIIALIIVGGFAIAQTPFHRAMASFAHDNRLPPPFNALYGPSMRIARPPDVYRGVIVATTSQGFTLSDPDGDVQSKVVITPRTRLPYGEDFSLGMTVLVVGDVVGTDTIQAFGVREIEE